MKKPFHHPRSEAKEDVFKLERKIERPKPDYDRFEREIRQHFEQRLRRLKVVKTTRTPSGQILDWIERASQATGGEIASPPPSFESYEMSDERRPERPIAFELDLKKSRRGPQGTVPVLRKPLEKLRFNASLQDYLSKHGQPVHQLMLNDRHTLEMPEDGGHDYAYTAQFVTNYGGEGALSAFDPYTQWSNEFSLQQIAVARGEGSGKQTLEAGWQEFRDLYGDWRPHLFIFYTTNGYSEKGDNKGGYNQDVDGWVQVSSRVYPGAVVSPNSERGGAQYMLRVKYQLWEGNWWLRIGDEWMGYYPASLFNEAGLRNQAGKVAFYGEVVDSSDHRGITRTDMGSGYWPEYGWPWSGYIHNIRYQHDREGRMTDYDADTTDASDPDSYDLETHMRSGSSWGSYFWLGGPGA